VVGGLVLDLIGTNGQRVVAQLGAGANLYQGVAGPAETEIVIGTQAGLTPAVLAALGGGISKAAIRVTLFDGDTSQPGVPPVSNVNQDFNENTLLLNDLSFGSWSPIETATTDSIGNVIPSATSNIGFFNEELDTGWFFTEDPALLTSFYNSLVSTGQVVYKLRDTDPGDNFRDFREGLDSSAISGGPNGDIVPNDTDDNITDTTVQFNFTPAVNRDVIVNTGDTTQDPIDSQQNSLVTQPVATAAAGFAGKGLPANGFFPANSLHPDIQLPYRDTDNGNNAWVAPTNGQGVTVDIPDAQYSAVHVAAVATDGPATLQATFNYTDGTQSSATANVPDWLDEITQSPSAYYLIDTLDQAQPNGTFEQANDPALFGFRFTPDATRTVQSVTLTKTGGAGTLNVFGATGISPVVGPVGPGNPGGNPGDIIAGGGGTGASAITRKCRNGRPLPPFPAKFFNRQEVIRLDNAPNTLGLQLAAVPGRLQAWRIDQSNNPKFVRQFNRQPHNSRAGYRVFGRQGNDVLEVKQRQNVLYGNKGIDTLTGGVRRDVLYGGPGGDILNGNIGRDIIVGGGGNDTLTGESGRDMFVYNTVREGTDLIKDFTPALDVIDLRTIFNRAPFQVGGQSFYQRLNRFVRLVETGGNTQVQIDANGRGAGQPFNTLAVLEGVSISQLTSCNFVL